MTIAVDLGRKATRQTKDFFEKTNLSIKRARSGLMFFLFARVMTKSGDNANGKGVKLSYRL